MLKKSDKPTKVITSINEWGQKEERTVLMTQRDIDEFNALEEVFDKMASRIGDWLCYGEIDNGALLMRHVDKNIIGTFFVN